MGWPDEDTRRSRTRSRAGDGEHLPVAGDPLERVDAPVVEGDAAAGHEVAHRGRHVDLPGSGERRDPGADVHRVPRAAVAPKLALADVQPRSDPEIETVGRVDDGLRALDPARGTVEPGEHPVARGVDEHPAVPFDLDSRSTVVRVDQLPPAPVSDLRDSPRGIDDVGEQHGCEHAIDVYVGRRS